MVSIKKISGFGRTYRHLNRYRQILAVFLRYGFDEVVDILKIDQILEKAFRMIPVERKEKVERHSRARRFRMALEELGPTFVKLGQILSCRPDLIPLEFLTELAKLQDEIPSFPHHQATKLIEEELGHPPEAIFNGMTQEPFASASIGQVYRARLKTGEDVAVKVQRPGIERIVAVDIEIMTHVAGLMERHIEELALHRPQRIVQEFARTIRRELDYTIEAANMTQAAGRFAGDETICVPMVYEKYSTTRILTTQYVQGIKVSDIEELDAAGLDRKLITRRGAGLYLKQVFFFGFFHADPHPGNIFVLPQNVICLIDFGMVGTVNRHTREIFVELIDSVVQRNEIKATEIMLKITQWEEEPDLEELQRDVTEFMNLHLYKPLREIQISKLVNHLLLMASEHRLRIPPNIFLIMKALATVEGVAVMLDPEFDMIAASTPFIAKIKASQYHPVRIAEEGIRMSRDFLDFFNQFPKDLLELGRQLRKKQMTIGFQNRGLDQMMSTFDQISNRISFSIIIAALVVGSALIVVSKIPPLFYGVSIIGIIGFIAAALMGIWLLVAILKKGL